MPTILSNKQQPGLLPSNPGEAEISPAQFGKAQDALAKVGGQIADIGNQYVEARAKVEENDAVMRQTLEDSKAVESKKKAIQQEYMVQGSDGVLRFDPRGKPAKDETTGNLIYPESYSKRIEQIALEQYENGKNNMPSLRAVRSYQQSADGMVIRESNQALNFEQLEVSRFIIENKDKFETESAQQVFDNPTLDNLTSKIQNMTKYFEENKGSLFDPAKTTIEHKKTVKTLIKEGYFEGLLDKEPEKGLAILDSIGDPTRGPAVNQQGVNPSMIANYLDAQDINNMRDKFEHAIKQKNLVEAHGLDGQLADIKAAALDGKPVGGVARVSSLIERQAQLGAFKTPEEKIRAYSDAISSVVVGQARSRLAGSTNEEIAAATKNYQAVYANEVQKVANREGIKLPPEFAAADSIEVKTKISAAINQVLKDRQQDPASSAIEGNNVLAKNYQMAGGGLGAARELNESYFAQSMAEQARLGSASPRPLTVDNAKAVAGKIAGLDSARSAVEVENLKQKTGKYFPQVMNQLIKDGNLPDYYAVTQYADSPEASAAIIDGMKNKATYETVLKDNSMGYKKTQITNLVNKEFDPYYKAMVGNNLSGENNRVATAIRHAIYYQTASLVSRGIPPDEAAAKATDVIIRNKNEAYAGVIIPKQNAEKVKAEMSYVNTPDFANRYVEKIYLPMQTGKTGFSALSEKANRLKMTFEDPNGHAWISKPDGSGAVLNYRTKNAMNPLGFDLTPVITEDKKPVEINWNDAKLKVGE